MQGTAITVTPGAKSATSLNGFIFRFNQKMLYSIYSKTRKSVLETASKLLKLN